MPMQLAVCAAGIAMALAICAAAAPAAAQSKEPEPTRLWKGAAPGALGAAEGDTPVMWVYAAPPETATGAAVLICPGGAYEALALDYEGHEVARWFNTIGVTAAVLRYRLGPRYGHPIPRADACRAIRRLRADAKALHIDSTRIGILGFSAGGHLAATVATSPEPPRPDAPDPVDRISSRPDFAILCYPVITMSRPFTHEISRCRLIGADPTPAQVDEVCAEKHVAKDTPPVFLFHTSNDGTVPVENSLMFYQACRQAGLPAEMHVYRDGPHGIGMNRQPSAATWPSLARDWMFHLGLLTRPNTGK